MVVVLIGAAGDREPVLLVLDVAPEQIVQRAQRIDIELGQRIARRAAAILEAHGDGVERLDEHPLLVPVRTR